MTAVKSALLPILYEQILPYNLWTNFCQKCKLLKLIMEWTTTIDYNENENENV